MEAIENQKTEANRRNARRSTGPKTPNGKSVTSKNALKHGLLAKIQVLPEVESQAEWNTHFRLVLEALSPAGPLETVLAEKVGFQLWRLKRLAFYEREVTAISIETVEDALSEERDDVFGFLRQQDPENAVAGTRREIQRLEQELGFLASLVARGESDSIEPTEAARLIEGIAEILDVDIFDDPEVSFPDYADGASLESVDWTAGYLKTCLSVICEHGGTELEKALTRRAGTRILELQKAQARLESLEIRAQRLKRQRILPNGHELEKIARYEAHLERSFYRALHELQRLQAGRNGQSVLPPAAVEVDVAVGQSS